MRTILLLAALVSSAPSGSAQMEQRKLTGSDGALGDRFGVSVAISGARAVVGAYHDSDHGNGSGSAYVFDVGTGRELAKLVPSDGAAQDRFGLRVAISGDRVLVGADADDDLGDNSGSAYVFDATTGQELFKLTASDGATLDYFGTSVAISGQRAVVGAYGDDDVGVDAGSAYVFDVSTGQELFKLTASDGALADGFGWSVAIDGDLAIVGAPGNDDFGPLSGAAYVFDVTTGQELYKLLASDGAEFDAFGGSVALRGDRAVVGADFELVAGNDSAYLFDLTTGQERVKLTASDWGPDDRFGGSVALGDDRVLVGAGGDDDVGQDTGSVYVFDRETGSALFELVASDAAPGDRFGTSVAFDGDRAVVGAPEDDDLGTASGSAYVVTVDAGIVYCDASQNPDNAAGISISTLDSSAASVLLELRGAAPGELAYLLVGDAAGVVGQPPGTDGDLCVAGGSCLGRYRGDVLVTDAAGGGATDVKNAASSPCNGAVLLAPGASWYWQYWHRRPPGQPPTFSAALATLFY